MIPRVVGLTSQLGSMSKPFTTQTVGKRLYAQTVYKHLFVRAEVRRSVFLQTFVENVCTR